MANSQHLAVRDAVAALLQAAPALAGGRVFENRDYKLAADASSGVWVFRDDSTPARGPMMVSPIDWTTRVRVVVKARTVGGITGTSAETAADTLATEAYARVMAAPQLGGLASDLEAGQILWQQDEIETSVAMCELEFFVQHRTTSNLLT